MDKGAPSAAWPEGKAACCPVEASSRDLSELTPAAGGWPVNCEIEILQSSESSFQKGPWMCHDPQGHSDPFAAGQGEDGGGL